MALDKKIDINMSQTIASHNSLKTNVSVILLPVDAVELCTLKSGEKEKCSVVIGKLCQLFVSELG